MRTVSLQWSAHQLHQKCPTLGQTWSFHCLHKLVMYTPHSPEYYTSGRLSTSALLTWFDSRLGGASPACMNHHHTQFTTLNKILLTKSILYIFKVPLAGCNSEVLTLLNACEDCESSVEFRSASSEVANF